MIAYAGLDLSQADALTALCSDLDVHGRGELWRFAPEDAALVAVQWYAAESRGLRPPMPDTVRATYSVAAGPEMIGRCEDGRTPVDWGYNDGTPVVVFRQDAPSRWPRMLPAAQIEAQYRALRGWLEGEPWPLPEDWRAAWEPLLGTLRDEYVRRFEAAGMSKRWPPATESLIEVIGKTVALTKHGSQYWGRCPFHDDRRPSLAVHPEKGWYCHVCRRGGGTGRWKQAMRDR